MNATQARWRWEVCHEELRESCGTAVSFGSLGSELMRERGAGCGRGVQCEEGEGK